jgi:ATPase subunit of ABC transporter with duplicated ATPase domains
VLVISHDRYFLDRTVQRIVELKHGRLSEYIGGYSDYAERQFVDPHSGLG